MGRGTFFGFLEEPFGLFRYNQSVPDARRQRDDWVNDLLSDCSVESLARALHAIQDEYSDAHNFQPWDGGGPAGWPGTKHVWKDSYGASKSSIRKAKKASIDLLKRFKKLCPCVCES